MLNTKIINNSNKIITTAFVSAFLVLFSLLPFTCVRTVKNWTLISHEDAPGVVAIIHFDQDRFFYYNKCTGILVAPDLVVTAGHCIRSEEVAGNDPIDMIVIGYNCDRVTHSKCDEQEGFFYLHKNTYLDIALFFLKKPIDYPTIPIAKRSPTEGQDILQAGYGRWSELAGGSGKVWVVAGFYFTTAHSNDMRPEKGDSGGPVYIVQDGALKAIGITVASHTPVSIDQIEEYQYVTYINLALQREWIIESYESVTGKEFPDD